jgi:nitrogen fixation protein NifU and related proteins
MPEELLDDRDISYKPDQNAGRDSEGTLHQGFSMENYGTLEQPDGFGHIQCDCEEDIRLYMRIKNGTVEEARYVADGCIYTLAACSAMIDLIKGQSIRKCFSIKGEMILSCLKDLPDEYRHCAFTAVKVLRKALRNYAIRGRDSWMGLYSKNEGKKGENR